jgi:hypothetical protein
VKSLCPCGFLFTKGRPQTQRFYREFDLLNDTHSFNPSDKLNLSFAPIMKAASAAPFTEFEFLAQAMGGACSQTSKKFLPPRFPSPLRANSFI